MSVTQVAPGVWRAGTSYVNWYVVDGGNGLTLIDAGLPRYRIQLDKSLGTIGRSRADVRAVVLTHGHIDHIGFADVLADTGVAVHMHPADTALADCVAQGAVRPAPMPTTVPLSNGELSEVPGRPVVVHAPGHTDGSCVLEFRDHGVVFVGDLLCTISPRTGRRADPQLQTRGSNRDSAQAFASLERLQDVQARVVLPGHGSPWTDGVEAAAASARRIGCR
jgi:glyoxylase-like metal-dependent hydrolase (beta-lactamase superfamily II)